MGWTVVIAGNAILLVGWIALVRYAIRSTAKECINIALAHSSIEGIAERIAGDIKERFGV